MDRDELVRRACDGDQAARDQIGLLLHHKLTIYFGHHGPREAAEMIQDTMVDVWAKAGEAPRTADAFVSWVFSYAGIIARRATCERRREHTRACKRERMLAPPPATSPSSELRRVQEQLLLERCMSQLPTPYRNAVQHRFDGGRDQDLAASEGVAVSTVRSRVKRGMAKLEQLLRDTRVTRIDRR